MIELTNGERYRRSAGVSIISEAASCCVLDRATGGFWQLPSRVHHDLLAAAHSTHCFCLAPLGVETSHLIERCILEYAKAGIVELASTPEPAESEPLWNTHDMLLHLGTRGRLQRSSQLSEGGAVSSSRVVRSMPPTMRSAVTLTQAFHDRETRYSAAVPSLAQLSELLAASMTARWTAADPTWQTVESRPYPSAGGLHPLTAYVAVQENEAVAAGVYRFDAGDGGLTHVQASADVVNDLLSAAALRVPLKTERVGALILLTARYQRVAKKYRNQAYRFILLEAGALLQTLYLHAGPCGLALAAIGSCDAEAVARALPLDPFEHPSVLEIVAGRQEGGFDAALLQPR